MCPLHLNDLEVAPIQKNKGQYFMKTPNMMSFCAGPVAILDPAPLQFHVVLQRWAGV